MGEAGGHFRPPTSGERKGSLLSSAAVGRKLKGADCGEKSSINW